VRWSESSLHLVSKTRSLHLRNVIRKLCPGAAHSVGRALMQNTTPQTCIVSRIVHCILETCSRDLKAIQRKYSFHHVVVAHKTPQVGIPTLPPRAYYLHCRSFFCHHILCCRYSLHILAANMILKVGMSFLLRRCSYMRTCSCTHLPFISSGKPFSRCIPV
jgi:hypothetical protein